MIELYCVQSAEFRGVIVLRALAADRPGRNGPRWTPNVARAYREPRPTNCSRVRGAASLRAELRFRLVRSGAHIFRLRSVRRTARHAARGFGPRVGDPGGRLTARRVDLRRARLSFVVRSTRRD